jgi:hypothetical protein
MLFLAVAGAVDMCYGILQVYIMKLAGPKIPYILGHAALTLCCFGLFFTLNRWAVAALLIPIWICVTMLFSVPYGVLGCSVPASKLGLYAGIMNCFVCIGEQGAIGIDALTVVIANHLPKKWNIKVNRANIGGGMFAALAGFVLSFFMIVPEEEEAEVELITTPLLEAEKKRSNLRSDHLSK